MTKHPRRAYGVLTYGPLLMAILVAMLQLHATVAAAAPLPRAEPTAVGMSAERLERIETVFRELVTRGELPGAVMMVARRGQLVFAKAIGERDTESGAPMTQDALFRIYSMTKPLTTVGALILMEKGRLALTDPVSEFLPAFNGMKRIAASADGTELVPVERPITIHDLMRHTAGLAYGELTDIERIRSAYAEAGVYQPDGVPFDARHVAPGRQVEGLAAAPLVHAPATVWQYSLATDMLGRVIEQISGQRLGDFLEAQLFAPLGMDDTGFRIDASDASRLAQPFMVDPDTAEPTPLIDVTKATENDSGGAGAVSTVADYLRFAQMLANGGALGGVRILSPTTVNLMAADHLGETIEVPVGPSELLMGTPGYAFGLGVMVRQEQGLAGLPGSVGAFMWAGYGGTFFWVDPAKEVVTVLMTQRPGAPAERHRILLKQLVEQALVSP